MSENKKFNPNIFEESLAKGISTIAVSETVDAKHQNSYCTARWLQLVNTLVISENKLIRKIGMPDGWTLPLFDTKQCFAEYKEEMLGTFPSVNAHHFKLRVDAFKEIGKRPPPITAGMGIGGNMDMDLPETEIADNIPH